LVDEPTFDGDALVPVSRQALYFLVEDVTDLIPISHVPIAQGFANEAYAVRTSTGNDLIVRIQINQGIGFANEASVMALCRSARIPVPEVYGVTILVESGQDGEAMVMAPATGHALSTVMDNLGTRELVRICQQLGRTLRVMHGIQIDRFGPIGNHGGAGFTTWKTCAAHEVEMRHRELENIRDTGLTSEEAEQLLSMVRGLEAWTQDRPVLCHGDLGGDHLYVDDDLNISGIIDFGLSQGGSYLLDIAMLLMYHPELDLDAIVLGYDGNLPPKRTLQSQIVSHQANTGLRFLAVDAERGDRISMGYALEGLRSLLRAAG
jgi:aminoglycoside phosphotransferase (APT) family kinase protein